MKKVLVSLLVGAVVCTMAACGNTNNKESGAAESTVQSSEDVNGGNNDNDANQGNFGSMEDGTVTNPDAMESEPAGSVSQEGTPAKLLLADFQTKLSESGFTTAEEMANVLAESEVLPFKGAVMTVEPGYLNGFKEEVYGFEEGAMFGPVIGAIPFVGYVFRVENDVDVFADNLKNTADLRWNVCTMADEMICEVDGNVVFFVMAPINFDE